MESGDLALAGAACRALAQRCREDARQHQNSSIGEAALERAKNAERLAKYFELQREALLTTRRHP